MKKLLQSVTLITCMFAILLAQSAVAQDVTGGLRYTIMVTKFENRSGWPGEWNLGDAWDTVLTDMLNQTGQFIVIGETDMRFAALDEQDFAMSGRTTDGKKNPAYGQMTPAQLLVKGAITHVQGRTKSSGGGINIKGFKIGGRGGKGEINATIYIVDSSTGQVLASKSVVGTHKQKGMNFGFANGDWGTSFGGDKNDNVGLAVQDACAEAVAFMIEQLPNFPWTGTVVTVRGNKVYINRGSREGVSPGDSFKVGEVEVIRDPDTGEVLDEIMTEIAFLEVSEVKEKLSIANVTMGDAASVMRGMTIHLP